MHLEPLVIKILGPQEGSEAKAIGEEITFWINKKFGVRKGWKNIEKSDKEKNEFYPRETEKWIDSRFLEESNSDINEGDSI